MVTPVDHGMIRLEDRSRRGPRMNATPDSWTSMLFPLAGLTGFRAASCGGQSLPAVRGLDGSDKV